MHLRSQKLTLKSRGLTVHQIVTLDVEFLTAFFICTLFVLMSSKNYIGVYIYIYKHCKHIGCA